MKTCYALLLAAAIVSLLTGCATTSDERNLDKLMQHRDWPRIQRAAEAEVKKREALAGWPDNAGYLPVDHKDKLWVVMAMTATPNGDVRRSITLMISDDGTILGYQRNYK